MKNILVFLFLFGCSVLSGQSLLLNQYISGGTPSAYDVDAQAYIDAIHTEVVDLGGIYGALTDVQVTDAINQFFLDLKGLGATTNNSDLYSDIIAMYPFIGATAAAHKYNAINPVDSDVSFRISWVNTATHNSDGITFSGTQYGNTHVIPANFNLTSDNHLSSYITSSGGIFLTSVDREFALTKTSSTYYYYNGDRGITASASVVDVNYGFMIGIGTTNTKLYLNDILIASAAAYGSVADEIHPIPIGCSVEGGTYMRYWIGNTRFFSVGYSLTSNQKTDFYDAVQKLQTVLGRNI